MYGATEEGVTIHLDVTEKMACGLKNEGKSWEGNQHIITDSGLFLKSLHMLSERGGQRCGQYGRLGPYLNKLLKFSSYISDAFLLFLD